VDDVNPGPFSPGLGTSALPALSSNHGYSVLRLVQADNAKLHPGRTIAKRAGLVPTENPGWFSLCARMLASGTKL
jgi:hypothetical protein